MIEVIDWQSIEWVDGGSYIARVGYTGHLSIEANNVTINMGQNVFNGNGNYGVTCSNCTGVTVIDGIYINSVIGVYANCEGYNGFTLKGHPVFTNKA